MAAPESHIRQWLHNRAFIPTIDPAFHDWMLTATFYTALHAVDALLAFDKVAVTNHEGRNRTLGQVNRYEKIHDSYFPLYNLARTIRYLADPGRWVPVERVEPDVIVRYLYPIESSVQKLLKRDLGLQRLSVRIT